MYRCIFVGSFSIEQSNTSTQKSIVFSLSLFRVFVIYYAPYGCETIYLPLCMYLCMLLCLCFHWRLSLVLFHHRRIQFEESRSHICSLIIFISFVTVLKSSNKIKLIIIRIILILVMMMFTIISLVFKGAKWKQFHAP